MSNVIKNKIKKANTLYWNLDYRRSYNENLSPLPTLGPKSNHFKAFSCFVLVDSAMSLNNVFESKILKLYKH